MSFTRCFEISSYLLVASGFAALAATGTLDVVSLGLFSAALVAGAVVDTGRLRRSLPAWLLNAAALAGFAGFVLDYLAHRSFVGATIRLVLFLSGLKLLTRSTDRDWVYLYVVSFAELLAASTLTIDLAFGVALLTFLVAGVNTLVLFEMRRSHARLRERGEIRPLVPAPAAGRGFELFARFPGRTVAWVSAATSLLIVLVAVPIFLLVPRVTLGMYNRPAARPQLLSGFSERVELGAIGLIKESEEVVMRVKVETVELAAPPAGGPVEEVVVPLGITRPAGPLAVAPKWRGVTLDHYDGRAWRRPPRSGSRRVPARGGYFQLQPDVQRGALALEQTIFLESLSTRAIFACGRPLAISTSVGALSEADSGDLFTEGRPPAKLRYSALSDVTPMDPARLWGREFAAPAAIRERYLQLPALDPRIAALARQVTRGRAHPYDQARALERFLRTSYGYSLELKGSPTTPDPLAAFLFDIRKGHCEYFASAMAIMLRQVGIPSRLVNGFRTGEYNRLGEAWVVRQYDAHSWVEAYFPPHGWVEFDPTPADPARVRSAFRKILLDLEDALDLWWSDEVVNYASGNQKKLFAAARERIVRAEAALGRLGSEFWRRSRTGFQVPDLRSLLDGARRHPGRLLIVPVALGLLAALSRLRPGWPGRALRDLRRLLGRHDPAASVTAFYADALALLERRGMARSPTQTPLEFAHSLAPAPFVPDLLALTEIYNRMRFGACSAAEDAARAARLLDALQTVLDLDRRSAKA